MNFHIPDHIMRWLGPAIIVAVSICVIFAIPIGRETLCEPERNCLVSWVSALSGWAAAAAAAVTIGSLRRQAQAQQKQTDFQLGDALPTIDAVQHTEQEKRVIIRM